MTEGTRQSRRSLFSIWRVVLAAAVGMAVFGGIAWQQGLLRLPSSHRPANSIMVLELYRHAGTWVFDDARVGLSKEPFVAGIPEMIDEMVKDIPDAEKGFRLLFSTQKFPGAEHKLTWRRGDRSGNWYYSEDFDKEGWLCPALFNYYSEAPKEIHVKAEALR